MKHKWIAVFFLFLILTCLSHHQIIQDIDSKTYYGNHDDVRFFLMVISWTWHCIETDVTKLFHLPIFYPHKYTLTFSETLIGEAFLGYPIYVLAKNVIPAYNVVILLSIVLTGFATYLLLKELTGYLIPAVLCGLAMLSPPEHYSELAHIQSLQLQWIPLSLFFLVKIIKTKKWFWFVGLGFSLSFLAYSNLYYAVFLFLSMLFFCPVFFVVVRKHVNTRLFCGLTVTMLILIFVLSPLIHASLQSRQQIGYEKELKEIEELSADLLDFLSSSSWFYFAKTGHWMMSEGHFPGVVIIVFCLWGIITSLSKKKEVDKVNKAFLFGSISSLIGTFLISMGPTVTGAGKEIVDLPYRFLYNLIPGLNAIRALSRLGVFTYFFCVVIAGYGIRHMISSKWLINTNRTIKSFFVLGLALLIILETFPPTHKAPYESPPEPNRDLMHFLDQQPPDSGVLHLPVFSFLPTNSIYEWWAINHWQPIIFAHSSNYPDDIQHLAEQMQYFPSYQSIQSLQASFPVRYIVLHKELYHDPLFKRIVRRINEFPSLVYVSSFGEDRVYTIKRTGHGSQLKRVLVSNSQFSEKIESSFSINQPLGNARYTLIISVDGKKGLELPLNRDNNFSGTFSLGFEQFINDYGRKPLYSLDFRLTTTCDAESRPHTMSALEVDEFQHLPLRIDVTSLPMTPQGLKEAIISVNGIFIKSEDRGLMLARIDPFEGSIKEWHVFDTHADRSASIAIVQFIQQSGPDDVLAGAVVDEASAALTEKANHALKTLGVQVDLIDYYRYGLAFISWGGNGAYKAVFDAGPHRVRVSLGPDCEHFELSLNEFEVQ